MCIIVTVITTTTTLKYSYCFVNNVINIINKCVQYNYISVICYYPYLDSVGYLCSSFVICNCSDFHVIYCIYANYSFILTVYAAKTSLSDKSFSITLVSELALLEPVVLATNGVLLTSSCS